MEWDFAAGDCIYRYSGPDGVERASPFSYNQPSLSIPGFVLGVPDGFVYDDVAGS